MTTDLPKYFRFGPRSKSDVTNSCDLPHIAVGRAL